MRLSSTMNYSIFPFKLNFRDFLDILTISFIFMILKITSFLEFLSLKQIANKPNVFPSILLRTEEDSNHEPKRLRCFLFYNCLNKNLIAQINLVPALIGFYFSIYCNILHFSYSISMIMKCH